METASEGERNRAQAQAQQNEIRAKRKMKSRSQLEALEQAYAVEQYPSESVRAELSAKLDLSDRQLQMWFCHRRLKDRKPAPAASGKRQRKESPAGGGGVVLEEGAQQLIIEARAVAFVEAQLGEKLREDGPVLGLEFDPLPPDAFGSSIGVAAVGQQKQSGWAYDANTYEQSNAKLIKGGSRTVHEYQFLPEKPTVRTDTYERATPSHQYGSPTECHHPRIPLSTVYVKVPTVYGFQSPMAGLNLLSQQGRAEEYANVHGKSFTNISMDAHLSAHPINQLNNPFIPFARRMAQEEDDVLQLERKHKSEEARIMREVEAHEKMIRKDLEKQDILRRKREEQIRKEMERVDRERRKEEERLLREKQREEERNLREQRRELERQERFLLKESMRAEKMRQKEDSRREKEAARLKAASERAVARKNAKESVELIEDECLELMDLAASSKGLPSILSLDYETLQNLESFRDMQGTFPPKSVQLKKPFGIQPWIDSEENIGNLLMAWRFLITFVDVLGLWPFTLDEFVQAFHDYDSRLVGEIHISLIRSIIRDIEDVARVPSMGVGANQNCAPNPGGGHPQIVEGAYAWGFDIKSWKCNLNSLTWPEILRQFAVSEGFGPQLKKRAFEPSVLHEENEGDDVKDIISNLRNGVAAKNAFAIMQERGFSNPRKSRHLLTPGTVKFAAFHVLSLEGSKGLNILEVADRIQKSGLRDLTTSKTPEASIAAALTRDSKLFERTAPSTYCVRAAYRKDTTDSEAVLSAARERIQIFNSKIFDVKGGDEAERDEDPEVDDLGTEVSPETVAHNSEESKKFREGMSLESRKGSYEISKAPGELRNVTEEIPSINSEVFVKVEDTGCSLNESVDAAGICNNIANQVQEDTEIDDSNTGEPWVQGLTEGEYSDLSVEERLNALVALIGVAIEGNSIRIVLEERLEAANALKKQMWAVGQFDKRHLKEEHVIKMQYTPFSGNRTEQILTVPSSEDRQSPSTVDEKNIETTMKLSISQEQMVIPQNEQIYITSLPSVGNLQMQEFPVGPDNYTSQQPSLIADKSRKQFKSYIGQKAEEIYVYRSLPLGQDRRHNRYWQFITSASPNDPGCGRIFVELHDGRWRLIDSEEGFDGLLASLDVRGYRESHLQTMLQKTEIFFKETVRRKLLHSNRRRHIKDTAKTEAVEMPGYDCSGGPGSPTSSVVVADYDMLESSLTFSIELGNNETDKAGALDRYQDLERWIWKECVGSSILSATKNGKKRCPQLLDLCNSCRGLFYFEENHCHSCHRAFAKGEIDFSHDVGLCKEKQNLSSDCNKSGSTSSPFKIRLLKILLALIEVSVPLEAFQPLWTEMNRKSWGRKLHSSTSAEDLLQVLASLESVVKTECLSANFETTGELLDRAEENGCVTRSYSPHDTVAVLPWIPLTTAAVALRLMEFDAAISSMPQQKLDTQKEKETGLFILPARSTDMKSSQSKEKSGTPHQSADFKEDHQESLGSGLASSCHGQGRGQARSGRVPKKAAGLRGNSRKKSRVSTKDRLGQVQVLKWKGRPRGRGGRKRGNQSSKGKETTVDRITKMGGKMTCPTVSVIYRPPKDLAENWNVGETAANNASGSGRSEYEEENGYASGGEFDNVCADDYGCGFNGKSNDLTGRGNHNVKGDDVSVNEEVDSDKSEAAQDTKGDSGARYVNGEWDDIADRHQLIELGEGTRSPSSDYSD
ncbi:homeobox-DDT domain protein RLT2 isoform X2 [Argentina anserina]|uniref:homeobox-DDT domain protein RLT2 isoform X2 n=1 Tax=Argentina anserina TaxID=57926 RepID=UPI00217678E7|nr:homeobox-DDT domain protein RLT2-like isoform X2 [Potentilla anserina]